MNLFSFNSKPGYDSIRPRVSLTKSFFPLFVMFQITGVDLLTFRSSRLARVFFQLCPKCLFLLCLLTVFVSVSATVYISSEKKMESALWLNLFFQTSVHVSLYRNRKKIVTIVRSLSRISKKLKYTDCNTYTKKIIYTRNVILFQMYAGVCYMACLVSLNLASKDVDLLKARCGKSQTCFKIGFTAKVISPVVMGVMLISFVNYYNNMCEILKYIFRELVNELEKPNIEREYVRLVQIYRQMVDLMVFIEDYLSFPVFATMLSIMGGLFRASYAVMFQPNRNYITYSYTCVTGYCYLYSLLGFIIKASEANRYAMIAREKVVSLPGVLPKQYTQLKLAIRKEFKRKIVLTFWKIYIIDRSMVINALGTLTTYGILIATLGNVQNEN